MTIADTLTPTSLLEIRIKTIANHAAQYSTIAPARTIQFAQLNETETYLESQPDIIEYAWNIVGKSEYYTHKGLAGVSSSAAALGKLGGSVKSKAKSKSSRANGKLGGRPRKAK